MLLTTTTENSRFGFSRTVLVVRGVLNALGSREWSAEDLFDQATKGRRWMPRHDKAMKDVVSCDKPRVGANDL